MALLQDWREYAYGVDINSKAGQAIWAKYFNEEKAVYEQLLANPDEVVVAPLVVLFVSLFVSSEEPPQPVNIVAAIAVHRSTLNTFFLIKSLL